MGYNFKEEWQKVNKKNVFVITLVILILVLGGCAGVSTYKKHVVANEKNRIEESFPVDLNGEPKRPSEYNVGMDYNKAVKEKKPILALFYADWCGYCVRFMPVYQKLSEKYGEDINFAKVNVEDPKYEKLVKDMRIAGFPTVFIIDPKYDNRVIISNTYLGSVEDTSIEIDRFLKIRKLLDSKK